MPKKTSSDDNTTTNHKLIISSNFLRFRLKYKSFEHLFLCYQGKWRYNRDAMYTMLDEWNNERAKTGIVTLQGINSYTDNIPPHEGDASIDNNPDVQDKNYYPNDIYSLGDINIWNNHFLKLDKLSNQEKMSKLEFCINFVISNPLIDKVIIGCDNIIQFKQIVNINFKKNFYLKNYFKINNEKLLNPSKWQIRN